MMTHVDSKLIRLSQNSIGRMVVTADGKLKYTSANNQDNSDTNSLPEQKLDSGQVNGMNPLSLYSASNPD